VENSEGVMTVLAERRLDVICPVFREEEGIAAFHAELSSVLTGLEDRYSWRVIYVLDPAPDATEERLREVCQQSQHAHTIVLSRRFGHQAALVAGLDHADADAVVMMDSDLQHPPETILEMVAAFERGADIVQGVRLDSAKTGWLKRTTSRAFYRLMSRIASINLEVGSADFRLLSRRVVDVFRTDLTERNPFVRGLTSWVGYTVAYVGFACRDRVAGKSKYSMTTLVEFAITGVTSFSKLPIRAAAVIGFVLSLFSLAYAGVAVVSYFSSAYVPPGWASMVAVVSFVGGVQLLFLGLIAEYVGQIFDEVKGRPRYLVARTHGPVESAPAPEAAGQGAGDEPPPPVGPEDGAGAGVRRSGRQL
jgi:dolichol-phosphate mannosyltransferase